MRFAAVGLVSGALTLASGCIFVDNDDFKDDGSGDDVSAPAQCTVQVRAPFAYYVCDDVSPWAVAQQSCAAIGADVDLASIEDEQESSFVGDLLSGNAWIGGLKTDGNWGWSDGSDWAFEAWGTAGPSSDPEQDRLLMREGGGWSDTNGSESHVYVCKGPAGG